MKERRAARNLVVSLTLVLSLAACGDNSTPPSTDPPPTDNPPTPTTPTPKEIGGTIGGWIGEEAVVRWETYNTDSDEVVVLAEAPISADGDFSLILPVGEVLASELFPFEPEFLCSPDSSNTVEVNPSSVELASPLLTVYASSDGGGELGQLLLTSPDATGSFLYLYATSDATITGECMEISAGSGGGGSLAYRFDLDLQVGWNEVVETSGEAEASVATGPFPEDASWTYLAYAYPATNPSSPCGSEDLKC